MIYTDLNSQRSQSCFSLSFISILILSTCIYLAITKNINKQKSGKYSRIQKYFELGIGGDICIYQYKQQATMLSIPYNKATQHCTCPFPLPPLKNRPPSDHPQPRENSSWIHPWNYIFLLLCITLHHLFINESFIVMQQAFHLMPSNYAEWFRNLSFLRYICLIISVFAIHLYN